MCCRRDDRRRRPIRLECRCREVRGGRDRFRDREFECRCREVRGERDRHCGGDFYFEY